MGVLPDDSPPPHGPARGIVDNGDLFVEVFGTSRQRPEPPFRPW
ncbi:hypothetical protein FTUN_2813 [Frigoriglobus tundricola]|uniref:Uncharacterized protein n=1 Tax=Frigoriglobus tundricola TaxID=2774151 RepID=A0A6M5YPU7_9BACT|nr:hypothetical protein FTUN_2813 [Frigoriglobus tundricola]